jgi:hypothetical protein
MIMRTALKTVLCLLVAGCTSTADEWPADTIPVITAPAAAPRALPAQCPAIDPAILTETRRVTPIASLREGEALTAALIGSEAIKNASLARLARAYEKCRRGNTN